MLTFSIYHYPGDWKNLFKDTFHTFFKEIVTITTQLYILVCRCQDEEDADVLWKQPRCRYQLAYLHLRWHSSGAGRAGITNCVGHVSDGVTLGWTILRQLIRQVYPVFSPSCMAEDSPSDCRFQVGHDRGSPCLQLASSSSAPSAPLRHVLQHDQTSGAFFARAVPVVVAIRRHFTHQRCWGFSKPRLSKLIASELSVDLIIRKGLKWCSSRLRCAAPSLSAAAFWPE